MLGKTEKKIYDILVSSGNAPKIPWEKCEDVRDMFNSFYPIGLAIYAPLKLGKNQIHFRVDSKPRTMLACLKKIFVP